MPKPVTASLNPSRTVEFFLNEPPAYWKLAASNLTTEHLRECETLLSSQIEAATRLRAYLGHFVEHPPVDSGDPDTDEAALSRKHIDAVAAQNILAMKVRRALGYTVAKVEVNF